MGRDQNKNKCNPQTENLTLVRGLGRFLIGEGVGDLEEQKSGGDEADGISLKRTRIINTFMKMNFHLTLQTQLFCRCHLRGNCITMAPRV